MRLERRDLERFGVEPCLATDDARLEREHHDRCLEARIEAQDLARLDQQARFLVRLADRGLVDRLVDLEEAARLRPRSAPRLDAAPEQDDLPRIRDRDRRDDETRVHVRDVPARRAGKSLTVLAGHQVEARARRRSGSRS